jgi:predicted dithiol-disulfide oxidoreductase (DUF899 family)
MLLTGLPSEWRTIMNHQVVSRESWIDARKRLLGIEKELTRMQDEVNRQRRELPWVKIEKEYVFDTLDGKQTLAQLFDGRSQLFVYHFMFAPGWKAGCLGCSFFADHVDGPNLHLAHHDVTFVAVSRAPLKDIEAYRQRMGWRFKWVSSYGTDFNSDYQVSFTPEDLAKGPTYYNFEVRDEQTEGEAPGISVFFRDEDGNVFHTYSAYARGDERGLGTYMFLDLTPKGRNETGPNYNLTDWVKRHDEY